jgi:hypothetical protein
MNRYQLIYIGFTEVYDSYRFNLHRNNCCRCGRLLSDDCDREDQGPYGRGGGHPQERRGPTPEKAGESLPEYRYRR